MEAVTNKLSLKPEVRSPFVPKKNAKGIFDNDLEMNLAIQIGDVSGSLTLSYNTDYDDPERGRKVKSRIYGLDQIAQVINIDVDDLVSKYTQSIPLFIQEIKVQTKESNGKAWDSAWIHGFVKSIKALAIPGVTHSIPTREEFVSDGYSRGLNVTIAYRNKSVIPYIDVERGVTKYILRGGYEYGVYRDARYLTPENLVKSFVKHVNDYWDSKDYARTKEEKRQETIKENIKKYSELFGECVHEGKTERYSSGPRKYAEYIIDSYYIPAKSIVLEGRTLSRKIKINAETNGLFTFGSFGYLTENDVKKMISILNGK